MRGTYLRKLKLIPTNYLKQDLVLPLNPHNETNPDTKEKELKEDNNNKRYYNLVREPAAAPCINEYYPISLKDFEEMCPPGGSNSVILYTTSLRGIRKTFQDCNTIHFLLRSFRVMYHERDVSLHLEYREELWKILGGKVIPPKLFIKGKYIGGADEVIGLHEMGWLGKILEGTPILSSVQSPCIGCANMRFTICSTCCGSCKVFNSSNGECFLRCPECNENGLVKCLVC